MPQNDAKVIRRSPLVVVRNLVAAEFISIGLFFLAAAIANYEFIYTNLQFTRFLSFRIAEFIVLSLVQTLIVCYIFARWYRETYEFIPGAVVHHRGVVFRMKSVLTFSPSFTVSCVQDPVTRRFNIGTVIIQDSVSVRPLKITFVQDPESYIQYLTGSRSNRAVGPKQRPVLKELLLKRESDTLEFKETYRVDAHENKVSKDVEHAVIKTIAAFLNTNGGSLVIGVKDSGEVIGLERDYKTLKRQNADGFEVHFTNGFNSKIGAEFRNLVDLVFETIEGKEVCLVSVISSLKPVYVSNDNGEEFYIRTGNATTNLSFRHAASYIESHWRR